MSRVFILSPQRDAIPTEYVRLSEKISKDLMDQVDAVRRGSRRATIESLLTIGLAALHANGEIVDIGSGDLDTLINNINEKLTRK